jgi:hypothetical protein
MYALLGIATALVLAAGANLNNYARAEETPDYNANMLVSPSIDRLGFLEPGKTYTRAVTTVNTSEDDMSFKVKTSTFWVEDESYEIKWGVSNSQYGKIANWTNIDPNKVHNVKAGETYEFDYNITVPADQPGGAQRLMLTINLGGKNDGSSFIAAETHINTLVFANIEGDVNPGAEIVAHSIPGFSLIPNINATSSIKNTGDVDLDITYNLKIHDFFSGDEVHTIEDSKVIMTDSTRMFEQSWTEAPHIGIFNVTQEITIMGEVHSFTAMVIVCPLWLIFLIVAFIILIIVLFIRKASARKRDTRRD